jgi:hypothetical protein
MLPLTIECKARYATTEALLRCHSLTVQLLCWGSFSRKLPQLPECQTMNWVSRMMPESAADHYICIMELHQS